MIDSLSLAVQKNLLLDPVLYLMRFDVRQGLQVFALARQLRRLEPLLDFGRKVGLERAHKRCDSRSIFDQDVCQTLLRNVWRDGNLVRLHVLGRAIART